MDRAVLERPAGWARPGGDAFAGTRDHPGPLLLDLQRAAGNRAVAALVGTRGEVVPALPPARSNTSLGRLLDPGTGRRDPAGSEKMPGGTRTPKGSTAPESEQEEGPVGNGFFGAIGAGLSAAWRAVRNALGFGPKTPATAPAPPTIASATVKAAPSGAPGTRKRVGVGEAVAFTGSAGGTWASSAGTPAPGGATANFLWTAPATAQTVTITLTVGGQVATDTITVVAPKNITMRNVGSHASQVGAGGACMLTEVTFNPTDVCLGATQWLEVPGPATGTSGFFSKFSTSTLHHNPNLNYALINDLNVMEPGPHNGPNDHAAWHSTPGPYSDGAFTWVVPNHYIIDGEGSGAGRPLDDTQQDFTMNAAGTMTITKAGAST